MNDFVSYLNTINNIGGNSTGSLAEAQVKSLFFDQIKVNRSLGKKTWCAACNLFREAHPDIVVTAYTFQRFHDYNNLVYSPNQRQVCVSDRGIIGIPAIVEEYL